MRIFRNPLTIALFVLLVSFVGFPPTAAEAGKDQGGGVAAMSYAGGDGLEFSEESWLAGAQATCNITCANGNQTSTEVDDMDGCVAACNEFCNTTRCRPA